MLVEHRGIVRYAKGKALTSYSQENVVLLLSPITFDASGAQIWGPLLNGGCVVIAPPQDPSLKQLGEWIKAYQINKIHLAAGMFRLMVDEQLNSLSEVRQIIVGGDVAPAEHIETVLTTYPNTVVTNAYGPTECSIAACSHPMQHGDEIGTSVPIGKPISDTKAYIMDVHLKPVPIGVSGELYLGGDGVARGYHNRPELTTDRFLPDPFVGGHGARMYRTGDRCRWREDGNIEFIGRLDNQVKLRGFRIELGEVETALKAQHGVRDGIVLIREKTTVAEELVAFVVAESAGKVTPTDVKTYLGHRLPMYMVPSTVVILDSFPITHNGKIDRKALESLEPSPEVVSHEISEPLTPLEKQLSTIWSEILEVENIGRERNFFDLGGHSFEALSVIAKVEEQFGVEVAVSTVFQAPTIQQFARLIQREIGEADNGIRNRIGTFISSAASRFTSHDNS